ncbi:MAG: type I methionyl aminopeptidase [Oscillospiraceae bacterium]|jgi:methionyl aminopeptidase|nr:type I methionyl aminopeptidase [Oscillospiraceae bacterium]
MIKLKTSAELEKMRIAGKLTANCLKVAENIIRPGISTYAIDREIKNYLLGKGATPSFLRLYGFPNSACISVNEEVLHGIPSKSKILKEGDIVSVDVGACYEGYNGDSTKTFPVGKISDEAKKLLKVTEEALYAAVDVAVVGARLGDIGSCIEKIVRGNGYGLLLNFCGHGIGRDMHEDPEVPNYGQAGKGLRLQAGMTIAIEPMVNVKGDDVYILKDKWTVVPKSHSLSAHFEHTVAITDNGPEILTLPDEDYL